MISKILYQKWWFQTEYEKPKLKYWIIEINIFKNLLDSGNPITFEEINDYFKEIKSACITLFRKK